jgi:polyhydroxyalkanoate synthesis regulator phasin
MMRRGAREANEESARLRLAGEMGHAIGSLTVFIAAITRLTDRVEALEKQVAELKGDPQ